MSKVTSLDLESGLEENDDLFSCSISSALLANVTSEPSPFCSTSVIHDNKVDNEKNMNLSSDHDEVMTQFCLFLLLIQFISFYIM